MSRPPANRPRLRVHRSYTVDEAAAAMGRNKATIRRWIAVGRIVPVDDGRPALLSGRDLAAIAVGGPRKAHRSCRADEAYCLRCRDVRPMAFAEAEIVSSNASGVNLRALCATCATVMHKRAALSALPDLARTVTLAAPPHLQHLVPGAGPFLPELDCEDADPDDR